VREPGVGRVLVASLHQAIAERLPMRLGFYESFLNPEGLRDGTIGVAPLMAVLSFLRQEGPPYDLIVQAAGEYAADWTVASLSPVRRNVIGATPAWLRTRLVMRLAADLVRASREKSRVRWTLKRGTGRVHLHESIFCTVRDPVALPLCGFYVAVYRRMLVLFQLPLVPQAEQCRGVDRTEAVCTLSVAASTASVASLNEESVA
jgi:hypothetical protein